MRNSNTEDTGCQELLVSDSNRCVSGDTVGLKLGDSKGLREGCDSKELWKTARLQSWGQGRERRDGLRTLDWKGPATRTQTAGLEERVSGTANKGGEGYRRSLRGRDLAEGSSFSQREARAGINARVLVEAAALEERGAQRAKGCPTSRHVENLIAVAWYYATYIWGFESDQIL